MIHIRVDSWYNETTDEFHPGRLACGADPLPEGDRVVFEAESYAYHVADCQKCNPGGPQPYGTPISQLSGRHGHPGFQAFQDIANSWGHE